MAAVSDSVIAGKITTLFADNTSKAISEADLREVTNDLNDSKANKTYVDAAILDISALTGTPYANAVYDDSGDLISSFELFDSGGFVSINTAYRILVDSGNFTSIDYGTRNLRDASEMYSLDYASRHLQDSVGGYSIAWGDRKTYDAAGVSSINYESRALINSTDTVGVDWELGYLYTPDGASVSWLARVLSDSSLISALDWEYKSLNDNAGLTSLDWQTRTTYDSLGDGSVDGEMRYLLRTAGTALDWSVGVAYDTSNIFSIDWDSRNLHDQVGDLICDWSRTDRFTIWSDELRLASNNTSADTPSFSAASTFAAIFGSGTKLLASPEKWFRFSDENGDQFLVPGYAFTP